MYIYSMIKYKSDVNKMNIDNICLITLVTFVAFLPFWYDGAVKTVKGAPL